MRERCKGARDGKCKQTILKNEQGRAQAAERNQRLITCDLDLDHNNQLAPSVLYISRIQRPLLPTYFSDSSSFSLLRRRRILITRLKAPSTHAKRIQPTATDRTRAMRRIRSRCGIGRNRRVPMSDALNAARIRNKDACKRRRVGC
jgi:hypothetical protein